MKKAPTALTVRASNLPVNLCEKTNMNIVAKSDLKFQDFSFNPVVDAGTFWLTSTDLAKALGYKKTDAVSQIYSRNADEFTGSMSMTLNMKVNGINNSLRNKTVRVYSLRGAHLVAMFATTDKAKEFRRWVLDILDREIAVNMPIQSAPSERERHAYNVDALAYHYEFMYEAWKTQIEPALRAVESPLAGRLRDRFLDGKAFMRLIKEGSEKQLKKGEVARLY
jgi:prophage antirepressor-like protein